MAVDLVEGLRGAGDWGGGVGGAFWAVAGGLAVVDVAAEEVDVGVEVAHWW